MKSLIKKEGSFEFLTEDGGWTTKPALAMGFASVTAVRQEKARRFLTDVELYVLQREAPSSLDFSLPIADL